MEVVADTTFYIDLQRNRPEPFAWLEANPTALLVVTPVTYGELHVGQPDTSIVDRLTGEGPRLEITFDCACQFGRIARDLRARG